MSTPFTRFIFFVVLILLAAAVQLTGLASAFGIKPNLILIVLIAISFFTRDAISYIVLVLIGGALIRFSPGLGREVIVLIALSCFAYWLRGRIVWPGMLTNIFLVLFLTVAFQLLLSPSFIYLHPYLVAGEVVFNVILSVLVYEILFLMYGETRSSV